MRFSRREMNELAVDRDKCAARSERNAQSGREAAADPSNSANTRAQAARAAEFAERHAQEYREEAAAYREGRIPGEDY